jgi:hypothetical protein
MNNDNGIRWAFCSSNSLGKAAVLKKRFGQNPIKNFGWLHAPKKKSFSISDLQSVNYLISWSIIILQIFTNNYLVNISIVYESIILALS